MSHDNGKSYGRNEEVGALFKLFKASRDISMHDPRRLGNTFLRDRHRRCGPKSDVDGCPSRAGRLHRHASGIPPLPETKSKQASLLAIVGQSCFKHDLTCLDFSRKW